MAEQVKQESNIVGGRAIDVLAAAYAAGRKVRFWLSSGGSITGVWQGRSGKTCEVFTNTVKNPGFPESKDTSKVYFGMDVADAWNNPCPVATREAMEAYRTAQIAEWNS